MPRESIPVIIERLENMEDKLLEKIEQVYKQACHTNGKVAEQEKWKQEHDLCTAKNLESLFWHKLFIYGSLTVIMALNFPKLWSIIKDVL